MELREFFKIHSKVALAFSGGVDSAYLLYAAIEAGADVKAYYVRSCFQPEFEYEDAIRLVKELGAELQVIEVDNLKVEAIASNPQNRCYHCKSLIMGTILEYAAKDGYHTLMDGTNASDEVSDRPGMKALEELRVVSPLRECGLTKAMIRELSREAGLFTWDKPAYACLATRIPAGERITKERLMAIEAAEGYMMSLGFKDFRVRTSGDMARLQLPEVQWPMLFKHREEVLSELKKYFKQVVLDMEVR